MTQVKGTLLSALGFVASVATLSVLPAAAQEVSEPAPAMHLKDVPAVRGIPSLTVSDGTGHAAHIFPTVPHLAAINRARTASGNADIGPLLYHSGGSIMKGDIRFYVIFWLPAHLQNGGATTLPAAYQAVQRNMVANYGGHSLSAINTQYYQQTGRVRTYINGNGLLAASVVDTGAYPVRTCTDSATPGNCLTDAQLRAKITSVMAAHGWTGGINKMFVLFTSSGMGSCFDNSNTSCAYVQYCAYHSYFTLNSQPVIYSNEPYGNASVCLGANGRPNGADGIADAAATAASHEISEAITDPLLNAWFTASGNENGDLCAYNYGAHNYDGGKANQSWAGHFFDLQQEFSNHAYDITSPHQGCIQVGP
jgi:hypothetical protein